MIGYKATDINGYCNGFKFEVGKTYIKDTPKEELDCCTDKVFHFCRELFAIEKESKYKLSESRLFEVIAGDFVKSGNKYGTNSLTILREIEGEEKEDLINSGDCNSGYRNSGDRNSGNRCSGDRNSGNRNSGNWNSGNWNSGYRNSGNWNSGDWNSGLFNTEKNPKIKIFDKDSDWTFEDWIESDARFIMNTCPYTYSDFICESDMTEEEKENHPEYKTIGGFVKTFVATKEDKEKWWNDLSDTDKNVIRALPNFDFDKFRQCVGF